jgi:hypothetical protein
LVWRAAAPPTPRAIPGARNAGRVSISGAWYYPAANELVGRLARIGILTEVTGRVRNRRFRYDGYIRLFADAPPLGDDQ